MHIKYSNWFGNTEEANIYVITDNKQLNMIKAIMLGINCSSIKYINIETNEFEIASYEELKVDDLIIVAFSIDSYINKEMNRTFSPFRKPKKINCKYIFIRLDISETSLREGLLTDRSIVEKEIATYQNIEKDSNIKVIAPGGTNLSFKINKFRTCSHFIDSESGLWHL